MWDDTIVLNCILSDLLSKMTHLRPFHCSFLNWRNYCVLTSWTETDRECHDLFSHSSGNSNSDNQRANGLRMLSVLKTHLFWHFKLVLDITVIWHWFGKCQRMQMSMRLRNLNRAPPKKISAGDKNSVIKMHFLL